jgi:hypothetical protein
MLVSAALREVAAELRRSVDRGQQSRLIAAEDLEAVLLGLAERVDRQRHRDSDEVTFISQNAVVVLDRCETDEQQRSASLYVPGRPSMSEEWIFRKDGSARRTHITQRSARGHVSIVHLEAET